jgi:uncharacterized protein (DUF488 family)
MTYSIGHSNFSIEVFIQWLQQYDVKRVVDVRTNPYSRFCPQYNHSSLSKYLEAYGIAYDFRGSNLGGKGVNVDYDKTLDELAELQETETIALLCSERDYKKCHRHTMLEPDLAKRGISIEHITYT